MPKSPRIADTQFAIVDVETTGLFAQYDDRIIEIAIIRTDGTGRVLDEYCTLVNPGRDVGPTDIHGIEDSDVIDAPRFREIAGDILAKLAGAVFVAHNVHFDLRFIKSELARIGLETMEPPLLCTMRLSQLADPEIPSRKLSSCCAHFGINHGPKHSAYHDAYAVAQLLSICMERCRASHLSEIGIKGQCSSGDWPEFETNGKYRRRFEILPPPPPSSPYIARLIAALPPGGRLTPPELDEYLGILDGVLTDFFISPEEAGLLFRAASGLGISKGEAVEIHYRYMSDMIRAALADGIVTDEEKDQLSKVRQLLSISNEQFQELLRTTKNGTSN